MLESIQRQIWKSLNLRNVTSIISRILFSDLASVFNCWVSIYQDVWDVGMTERWQTVLEVSNVNVSNVIANVTTCYPLAASVLYC